MSSPTSTQPKNGMRSSSRLNTKLMRRGKSAMNVSVSHVDSWRHSMMNGPSGRCSSPSTEHVTPVITRIITTTARHHCLASQ